MQNSNEVKEIVKEKYGEIAKQSMKGCGCGCGCSDGSDIIGYTIMQDEYSHLNGYFSEADLKLGCGIPTEHAGIKFGDTVVDLGSGAGNDAFVARAIVGETGKVIGIDMTEAMIEKANRNKSKLGFENVEFKLGDIENMPVENSTSDVVISNCVLNLVPDKEKAFKEIFRVLKPGGHFSVSDVVASGELPASIEAGAELYAGCVSGAIKKEEYLVIIEETGFENIKVQKERIIAIPDDIYLKFISEEELKKFKESGVNLISINVYADKPMTCCEPGSGCC